MMPNTKTKKEMKKITKKKMKKNAERKKRRNKRDRRRNAALRALLIPSFFSTASGIHTIGRQQLRCAAEQLVSKNRPGE